MATNASRVQVRRAHGYRPYAAFCLTPLAASFLSHRNGKKYDGGDGHDSGDDREWNEDESLTR
ncbi:hypothetical protein QM588_02245 [Rhodococcus sp. IEGM 1354]|uniref:hypothetical protein n=1 Tax=Rhodococcus sp. IEGM 1354 TaxID=3047088 RepID=UPI0024B6CD63|nr:hypothetical protein [Rhodococcus sp. IEGM 1354]MDI9929212.1 hypothetical protein [Rhodococcus sp. IEGM 1354]